MKLPIMVNRYHIKIITKLHRIFGRLFIVIITAKERVVTVLIVHNCTNVCMELTTYLSRSMI